MPRVSAGLLMHRVCEGRIEVLLVHPGGPFFQRKDDGAWTIPKGEPAENEDLLSAARREFHEETGLTPSEPFLLLTPVKQKGGKVVHAWTFPGDCDPHTLVSNKFQLEWPPKSGRLLEFPEIDRAEFFDLATARKKINPAQAEFLNELADRIAEIG